MIAHHLLPPVTVGEAVINPSKTARKIIDAVFDTLHCHDIGRACKDIL